MHPASAQLMPTLGREDDEPERTTEAALGSIEDGLAGSDPRLASMLNIFSRLAAGEEMPVREKIRDADAPAHPGPSALIAERNHHRRQPGSCSTLASPTGTYALSSL